MNINNCTWIIAVAPKNDRATEDSQNWCAEALDSIEATDMEVYTTRIFNADAIKNDTNLAINKKPKAKWFIHYGHGNRDSILGNDGNFIINDSNLHILEGMHVYCCNCSSGAGLGRQAIDKGILEYWGFLDTIGWTTRSKDNFGDVVNYGIKKSFKEKKTLNEVVEDAREYGYEVAEQLENDGYFFEYGLMVQAMNNLRVYSKEEVEFQGQNCMVTKFLRRLYGLYHRVFN